MLAFGLILGNANPDFTKNGGNFYFAEWSKANHNR